ncbi:MAG: glycosyltransferase family 2 protein [Rhodospirillales bacterium]|nr:MAG: glycosyltransferase family 2 protein [Rhodospirillales bacterium]
MRSVDISVVVTNFNYGRFIRRCIRSLLNQDLDRHFYEIIVVDDCSTDDSLIALEPFRSSGEIRVVVNKENLGVGGSARAGVNHSRAKFFVRVDADDYVQPQFLYILYHFLRLNQNYIGVSCDYFLTTEDEKILSVQSFADQGIACGLMLRTSYLEKVGSYDPTLRLFEDKDLISRVDMERVYHLPIPIYNYVKHGNSLTDNTKLGTGAD